MGRPYFTVEQANRTLPLVRAIVRDIRERWDEAERCKAVYQELRGREPVEPTDRERLEEIERRYEEIADAIRRHIGELEEVGATLKDFRMGLVDFPARRDGRTVWLCWKPGEESVTFWHEQDAGFSGRRPIEAGKEWG